MTDQLNISGLTKRELKILTRALELYSSSCFGRLESCQPRPDMPDAKPEIVADIQADLEASGRLYDEVRRGKK